jgi:hypothetical protein
MLRNRGWPPRSHLLSIESPTRIRFDGDMSLDDFLHVEAYRRDRVFLEFACSKHIE